MAEVGYTQSELEEAKAYLRDRLRNEHSMNADIEELLVLYAGYLLSALFDNEGDEFIEGVIENFIQQLLEDCEVLAVDEHDKEDLILDYMLGERNGDTLEGRVQKRANTFFNECFALYLAGKVLGKGYKDVIGSVKGSLADPWNNEFIKEAREKQSRGELPGEYDFDEPHYGKGNPISSLTALEHMLDYAIGDAWMWWGHEDAREKGAKGYFVLRGSSYPCPECDSHTGIFYRIDDEDNRPQYHLNCCCLVVYSYVERL